MSLNNNKFIMKINDLLNKKILIWGYGLEGKSAMNFFLKKKIKNTIIIASNETIYDKINGVEFILESEILNQKIDVIIKSPGISFYREEIKFLQEKNIIITSILNILLAETENLKKPKTIAITGTKGKSTTSSLCYHILKELGYKVAIVGNIGISFLDVLANINEYDYLVLELSSCQTTNLLYFIDYTIVLNLFPEHIDWHLTHENYFKDKMNINNFSKNKIINFNNVDIQKYLDNNSNYFFYNTKNTFHINNGFIYDNETKLFNINDITNIKGEHIFQNLCSIFTILKKENINFNKVIQTLVTFKTLEHRIEIFFEDKKRNIIYVNDSISTIPEATIECLKTFNNYYIKLIIGGFNRQQNYLKLLEIINNSKIEVFLLGDTGEKLQSKINNSHYFNNFEDLIKNIKFNIQNNTAIILSPAAASFDMFKNFEERGKIFKKLMLL